MNWLNLIHFKVDKTYVQNPLSPWIKWFYYDVYDTHRMLYVPGGGGGGTQVQRGGGGGGGGAYACYQNLKIPLKHGFLAKKAPLFQ